MGRRSDKTEDHSATRPAARTTPAQSRARRTVESILSAAAELLGEVGVEQLSTNLVCRRAGMTPPALYRYFPDKYAILSELARRLLDAQAEAVFAWVDAGGLEPSHGEDAVAKAERLQQRLNEITRHALGGVWILRALGAVPRLRDIRIAARDEVARHIAAQLSQAYPGAPESELLRAARLTVELSYAVSEMVLVEPVSEEPRINQDIAWMVTTHYQRLARLAVDRS
ncbi:helix-turn-helix domain-containing protein [Phenylobacterium sp.]|uniref:TetR/AcrR family transcriptional regulator n=1 Tax=Phenylobacterium sp. TaxID=1871053 RepID=UPI002ED9B4A1